MSQTIAASNRIDALTGDDVDSLVRAAEEPLTDGSAEAYEAVLSTVPRALTAEEIDSLAKRANIHSVLVHPEASGRVQSEHRERQVLGMVARSALIRGDAGTTERIYEHYAQGTLSQRAFALFSLRSLRQAGHK